MRKYRTFFEGGSEYNSLEELANLLTDPTIRVLWKHAETILVKTKERGIHNKTIFYVFYQDIKEELQYELSDFRGKLEIAKQVSMDEKYYTLKNQKQRELFLLSEYSLPKSDAQDVIELLKPELAKIIRESEEEDVKGAILTENPKKASEEEVDKEMEEMEKKLEA